MVTRGKAGVQVEEESMTRVSVVVGTSRPGGLDITLRGMADQTFKDFEVILVDGRYHKRHEQVLDFAASIGLKAPLYHVPNQRYNGYYNVFASGWNTAFMLASGEIVIMLMDYSYTPPGWIENHLFEHRDGKPKLVMSPQVYLKMPPVTDRNGKVYPIPSEQSTDPTTIDTSAFWDEFPEISVFEKPFDPPILSSLSEYKWPHRDPKLDRGHGPVDYTLMHCKNESFPLEGVLEIGGIDENFEKGKGPIDNEFGFRFFMSGHELFLTQNARVYCLNPRFFFKTRPWGDMEISENGRWSWGDGVKYQDARYMEMRNGAPPVAKNPYNMRERRNLLWHWRELSQKRELRIPYNDVSDELWYSGDLGVR